MVPSSLKLAACLNGHCDFFFYSSSIVVLDRCSLIWPLASSVGFTRKILHFWGDFSFASAFFRKISNHKNLSFIFIS